MRRQQGFSYLIALFALAVLSILALRALENTMTAERRSKEAELLDVGQAYRNAIRAYYENTPGSDKKYPSTLKGLPALLLDDRATRISRPLRKLYRDPITGSQDWGIVYTADGKGVMGVYSLSPMQPIKVDGFPIELMSFTGAKRYQDWLFVYKPN